MQAGIDEFMAKYVTGLNIKEQEVGKFKIKLHNIETQKAMIKVYKLWEQERRTTMAEIEKLNDLKSYLLNNMFV